MSTTPIPTWMQDEVLERDNWTCLACKRPVHRWRGKPRSDSASIDHIYPDTSVHRGMTEVDNLQTLCRDCNSAKGSNYIDYRPKPPEPEPTGTYEEQLVHPTYAVGEVVNGHQWTGTEWAKVHAVGEVINGHRWDGTTWVPVSKPSKLMLGYPKSQWRNALIFVVVFYSIIFVLSQS